MFVMSCAIVALLSLCFSFLCFDLLVWTLSKSYGLCHFPYTLALIKGFGSTLFTCLYLLASVLYACVSLSRSRLCHVWRPPWAWPCVVTSDAYDVLFGCNHLGCITMRLVALCIPFPFLLHGWYAYHACLCHPLAFYAYVHICLHVHAWVLFASASPLLQNNGVVDIRSKPTFVHRGHHLLFALWLICLLACLLAFLFLCLPCLSCLSALCLFHMLFASFPSIACLLVSCLCLCMYTHGVRMHGTRARSPKRKQKGRGCKHVDMSQAVVFCRFRGLASPFWLCTLLNPFLPHPFLF